MKCPKCEYLGFETGDRCRHCGYDFSLISPDHALESELPLREFIEPGGGPDLLGEAERRGSTFRPAAHSPRGGDPGSNVWRPPEGQAGAPALGQEWDAPPLPLFRPPSLGDDTPLVTVSPVPRPPLAVRRTPVPPRPRAASKPVRATPAFFEFADELASPTLGADGEVAGSIGGDGDGGIAQRLGAVALDAFILVAIDGVVIYLTLRLAGLTTADWSLLPPIPVIAFLGLLKVAYFSVFTALGGQTIGKMALGIQVVGDSAPGVDPTQALGRTLAGAVSFMALGLVFTPWLRGRDGRPFHDRVAHTRVVTLRPS